MNKAKISLLLILSLVWCSLALAGTTRTIDADAMISSNKTYTWTHPLQTGTVMISAGIVQETPSGTVNGSNTTFTTTYAPSSAANLELYQDGLLLVNGTDYTLSSSTITMTTAPATGQTLTAKYSKY